MGLKLKIINNKNIKKKKSDWIINKNLKNVYFV